jgi:hypothetical protein
MQTSSSHFTRHVPEIIIHCGFGKHEFDPTGLKSKSNNILASSSPIVSLLPRGLSSRDLKVCLVLLSNCFYFFWFNRHSSPTPNASTGCEVLLFVKITRVAIGYERTASFFFLPPVNCPLLSLSLSVLTFCSRSLGLPRRLLSGGLAAATVLTPAAPLRPRRRTPSPLLQRPTPASTPSERKLDLFVTW